MLILCNMRKSTENKILLYFSGKWCSGNSRLSTQMQLCSETEIAGLPKVTRHHPLKRTPIAHIWLRWKLSVVALLSHWNWSIEQLVPRSVTQDKRDHVTPSPPSFSFFCLHAKKGTHLQGSPVVWWCFIDRTSKEYIIFQKKMAFPVYNSKNTVKN